MSNLVYQLSIGSDCVLGKTQYADRQAAQDAAKAARVRGWYSAYAYRCQYCSCYHIGNRRGQNSKGRTRV